jgi:hypothetical protein
MISIKELIAYIGSNDKLLKGDEFIRLRNDIMAWRIFNHPNIVSFYNFYKGNSYQYFFFELSEDGYCGCLCSFFDKLISERGNLPQV